MSYRVDGSESRTLASSDAHADGQQDPAVGHIAGAWPHLPPHVKEAIFTLVDGALAQRE